MRQHEQAMLLVKKAADDEALLAEILSSSHVSDEIFGFHCQQAAEKLLKALLSQAGIGYPRTHHLRLLMDLLADSGQPLPTDLSELELDREPLYKLVRSLHEFVEKRLS